MKYFDNEVIYAFVNSHPSPVKAVLACFSAFESQFLLLHHACNQISKLELYFAFHSIGRVVVNTLTDERGARQVCKTNSKEKKIILRFFSDFYQAQAIFHIFTLTAGAPPVNSPSCTELINTELPWTFFGVIIHVYTLGEILTPRKCGALRRFFP